MKHSRYEMRNTTTVLTMMGTLILAVCKAAVQGQESAPSSAAAENGKKVYDSQGCWHCHGSSAQGGTEGPILAPDPIPFPEFVKVVRSGKGEMPPFDETVLNDSDLEDIYAFLKNQVISGG